MTHCVRALKKSNVSESHRRFEELQEVFATKTNCQSAYLFGSAVKVTKILSGKKQKNNRTLAWQMDYLPRQCTWWVRSSDVSFWESHYKMGHTIYSPIQFIHLWCVFYFKTKFSAKHRFFLFVFYNIDGSYLETGAHPYQ